MKKIYLPIPRHEDVYYGVEIKPNTKLEFENAYVKQKLENLVLYTTQNIKTDEFKTSTQTELYLKEGDLLLLEEEYRGYFKPAEIKFGSVNDAMKELKFIKQEIKKCKE